MECSKFELSKENMDLQISLALEEIIFIILNVNLLCINVIWKKTLDDPIHGFKSEMNNHD